MPNFDSASHAAVDVQVTSSLRPTILNRTEKEPLYAAGLAYNKKIQKYAKVQFHRDVVFKPFIVEEFGALHKDARNIFDRLCAYIATRKDQSICDVKHYYGKRLSCLIMQHNSRAILDSTHSCISF